MDSHDLKQPINNAVFPPVSSQEQFATWTGVSKDTVRGWVEQGTLPTVKIGRQRFINVLEVVSDLVKGKSIFSGGDYHD